MKVVSIKTLLIIEGFLLLLSSVTTFIGDELQSKIEDKIQFAESRFLELLREEQSISDSRLEFMEMVVLKDKLELDTDQKLKFKKDLEDINSRYKNKLDSYHPELQRESEKAINSSIKKNQKFKNLSDKIGFCFVIAALLINILVTYKYSKEKG